MSASPPVSEMMAALRAPSDHWQDSYHRLADAHRRLQRVNQGLEDKLLRLADRSHSEKEALTEQIEKLSTALTTAASAIHRLKGEKERLQQDLNLAIELLQCNSSQYGKHKIDSLPPDLQQRVAVRMESEGQQQRNNNNNATKAPEMKVIRVPIPTFPPTAMVYSLNKCNEDAPDEEEVQEAEDMVSAAIMAAVLEERQKEQRHCPTCTCTSHESSPNSANKPGGNKKSGPKGHGRGASASGNAPIASNSFFTHQDVHQYSKSCSFSQEKDQESKPCSNDNISIAGYDNGYKSESSSRSLGTSVSSGSNRRGSASGQCVVSLLETKNFPCNARTQNSALIDLINDECAPISEVKNAALNKEKISLVDLSSLQIREHFNSETMSKITVNKCICGRPYSEGSNVIDVGTQTVPSYIGESGKVHSTCIYCKGQQIRDGYRDKTKENKVVKNKRELRKCLVSEDLHGSSSPRSSSDGESLSLLSSSDSCLGDLPSSVNANDSICSSMTNVSLVNSSITKKSQDHKLGSTEITLNSLGSVQSWDWISGGKKSSQTDSGSPSTPNSCALLSNTSSSCESGFSCSSSPRHLNEHSHLKAKFASSFVCQDTCCNASASRTPPSTSDVSTQCSSIETKSKQAQTFDNNSPIKDNADPAESILDSPLIELDEFSPLEVSTDLLARLTSHFDYFNDDLLAFENNKTHDNGIFSKSCLNDKSIPYILDSLAECDRSTQIDVQRNSLLSNCKPSLPNPYKIGSEGSRTANDRRPWAEDDDIMPSIHRPFQRCAPEQGVVASTTTASATVTSL